MSGCFALFIAFSIHVGLEGEYNNIVCLTDNNAQSGDTHIVPIIGYSKQYIFIYEFHEGFIIGADYSNNIFYQITQEGSFNTMTIKPKNYQIFTT